MNPFMAEGSEQKTAVVWGQHAECLQVDSVSLRHCGMEIGPLHFVTYLDMKADLLLCLHNLKNAI